MSKELAIVREGVTGNATDEARELCNKHYSRKEIDDAIESEKKRRAKLLELQELQKQNAELEASITLYRSVEDIDIIAKVVAAEFNLTAEKLKIRSREQRIAHPRQVTFYLCRTLTRMSLSDIGRRFGSKDHGTVHWGIDCVRDRMDVDLGFRQRIEILKKRCQEALKKADTIKRALKPLNRLSASRGGVI